MKIDEELPKLMKVTTITSSTVKWFKSQWCAQDPTREYCGVQGMPTPTFELSIYVLPKADTLYDISPAEKRLVWEGEISR